ncbi:MAG: Multidrug resistance protein, partial [uncultured Pseudonocardia sp.]
GQRPGLPPPPRRHPRRVGHPLHGVVRDHLLRLPADAVGVRDRGDRRAVPRAHRADGHRVRQHRRPPPQAAGHDRVQRRVAAALRGCVRPVRAGRRRRAHRPGEPAAVGVRRAPDGRGDRRQPARDRPVHRRHAARAGRAARPGQRAGRHGVGGVVPRHLGDQRAARGLVGDVPRAPAGAGGDGRLDRAPAGRADPRRPPGRRPDRWRARRPARHPRRDRRIARAGRAHRLQHDQQLPRRRLHGPARRLRLVPDVRAGLGAAVRRAVQRLHHRRAGGRAPGPGGEPAAHAAAGERRPVGHRDDVHAAPLGAAVRPRHVLLPVPHPRRRGRGADGAAEGGARRAAGPGVRVRPERGAGRVAAHRVPHQPGRAVRVHPLHDDRRRRRPDRRLVRHRVRPRPRTGVRAHRADRAGGHPRRVPHPALPRAGRAVRRGGGGAGL